MRILGGSTNHGFCLKHSELHVFCQYYDFLVRQIYTTVVQALDDNKDRKFQAVEMIYFKKWWDEASDEQKKKARTLLKKVACQSQSVGG